MNILKLTIALVIILFSYNVNATNYKFVGMDKSIETKMCVQAASNDTKALKVTMRFSVDSKPFIANSITCNDMVMVKFANKYGAVDTTKYLNKYTRKINRVPQTKVTISDLASVENIENDRTKIIYVGTAN